MSYDEDRDGYAIETTWADGTTLDSADDTALLMGRLASRNEWPSPTYSGIYSTPGVNAKEVAAGKVYKSNADLRGMITMMLQNGIPIMLAMGKSSTVDADPVFTHTITPHTDGSQLPSVVWQHEERGSGTNEEYQFRGCKVDSLLLKHDLAGDNMLMGKMEIMAGVPVDPAFALTNDPALPTNSGDLPFINLTRTWDYGSGNLALDGLSKLELTIINGLEPKYSPSYDAGVYTGRLPYMLKEDSLKKYRIHITMHPDTVERAIWDELISQSNTKELYFKWDRGTNDTIEVVCTDCQVLRHDIVTDVGKHKLVVVEMEPRALSFTVIDAIDEVPYNE